MISNILNTLKYIEITNAKNIGIINFNKYNRYITEDITTIHYY